MPQHISKPTIIEAAGNKPKIIEEFFGRVNSGTSSLSVAKMTSPEGWEEPGQTPEFDEYTIVLSGLLRIKTFQGILDVKAGEAICTKAGEWVQYSTPNPGGAEYIAVCQPAFAPDTVHREEVVDPLSMREDQVREASKNLRKPEGDYGKKIAAWMNEGNAVMTDFAYHTLAQHTQGGNILEIGFGNGLYLPKLLHQFDHVTGLDYSKDMVELASEINKEYLANNKLFLKEGDAADMPFEDQSFDAIVSINTLYFWNTPEQVAREILRVLKPGGYLALAIRAKSSAEKLPLTKFGFTLYEPKDAIQFLTQQGFVSKKTETILDNELETATLILQAP